MESLKKYRFSVSVIIVCLIVFISGVTALSDDSTAVEKHGLLTVSGNRIVDEHGNPVVLRGMSLYWSQWCGKYYNADCIEWLKEDWQCTVVRASMGIEGGGYLTNPTAEKAKIKTVINACIDQGIYVLVDWHDHNAHNHQEQAIEFFEEIAEEYGDYPNIIYEIFNEPQQIDWATVIKPYSNAVIDAIRAIDPDNLIVAGTRTWSQDVDVASRDPLTRNNIAYALHYYAAYQYHKQAMRNKALTALNNGIALFVTEFGTVLNTGDGPIDSAETKIWMNFMEYHQISWCNWSLSDIDESSAALKPGANALGGWAIDTTIISKSGRLIRNYIINGNTGQTNDIAESQIAPAEFRLNQNYPNPFNPSTQISFYLPENAGVFLTVYNINGQLIRKLESSQLSAGNYLVTWSGESDAGHRVANGVYIIKLTALTEDRSYTDSKKMLMLE